MGDIKLVPEPMAQTEAKYSRQFPRRKFSQPLGLLHMARFELVTSAEIGEGGILFRSSKDMVIGQPITLSFFVPQKGFITVMGEILYKREQKNDGKSRHFGIKFLDLEFECKRMIRDYIALKTAGEAIEGNLTIL